MSAEPAVVKPAGTSAAHWSQRRERGTYLGLWTMLATYRLFGRWGFRLLLLPVMLYFFAFGSVARRASLAFLGRVHADAAGCAAVPQPPTLWHAYRHFRSFGEAILDKVAAWIGDIPLDRVVYEGRETFEALERSGRGGVLIASHLGNIEVCRALGSLYRGLKITVVVHTGHAQAFNRLLARTNGQATVSLLETSSMGVDTAIHLRDRIARGEFVVIVADRTPAGAGRTVSVPFLGEMAPFPVGPFVLAALMECPVQLIFCLKEATRYRIVFEPFADPLDLPRRTRATALASIATRYAERLGHHAVRHPYQWFNFFDFWTPAAAAASTPERDGHL